MASEGGGSIDTFGFPYTPYPLQQALMSKVYEALEGGSVGILESPTGTGKTLSLLCPTLAWLRRREKQLLTDALTPGDKEGLVIEDWARQHRRNTAAATAELHWQRRRERREERRQRLQRTVAVTSSGTLARQKVRRIASPAAAPAAADPVREFSLEAPLVLEPPDLHDEPSRLDAECARVRDDAFNQKLQVIFCSRTHSQLQQVLREIRSIPMASVPEDLSVVTLGARSNLCIKDSLRSRARGSAAHLKDLCRMATEKPAAPGGCALKKQAQVMTDACLVQMMDIEAMAQRGRAPVGGGCPYYGSRQAVREADVLLMPYASLVNSETRRKLGIRTEGNILIFDEAHNLLEAISDANSLPVTVAQACATVDDLDTYLGRYEKRLCERNLTRLKHFRQFCSQLHQHLACLTESRAYTVGAFLVEIGADHFDLPALSRFLEETELPRKVRGYSEAAARANGAAAGRTGSSSSVYAVAELLVALLGSTGEDRILSQAPAAASEGEGATVRYLSLDAEARFSELVVSARTILFAGGTLEPRAEFSPLFSRVAAAEAGGGGAAARRSVINFAGRHVIPPGHLCARYVTHGPAGHQLDFRRDKRGTPEQKAELRAILHAAAAATPGGAIFFFPSFEFLGEAAPSPGARLGGKQVFVEARGGGRGGAGAGARPMIAGGGGCAEDGESGALRGFMAAVHRDGGAVLLAVSGAKLSEGIDFKDELCRLVAVVGLPYPNASDLALVEKMRFLDTRQAQGQPGLSGREYYAARCMKAVNQCVGRSIRHAADWAAILLLDHRYATPRISGAVSFWLYEQAVEGKFPDVEASLLQFFRERSSGSSKICA